MGNAGAGEQFRLEKLEKAAVAGKKKTPAGEEIGGRLLFSNAGLGGGCPANVRAERGRRFAPTEFLEC